MNRAGVATKVLDINARLDGRSAAGVPANLRDSKLSVKFF
jgi:hypothetical protein